jgi:hypothetical protein
MCERDPRKEGPQALMSRRRTDNGGLSLSVGEWAYSVTARGQIQLAIDR